MEAIFQTFPVHFLEWKQFYFDSSFTDICFQMPNWKQTSIGLDNGLGPLLLTWFNFNPSMDK